MLADLDSPSMHFAIGMLGTLVLCLPVLVLRPGWWPFVPLVQTVGGVFALVPDWVYVLGYYPSLPFAGSVDFWAAKSALHGPIGNLFFFHSAIDRSGEGSFLRGFVLAVAQYNAWLVLFALGSVLRRRRARRALDPTAGRPHRDGPRARDPRKSVDRIR